jgi:hypothetical protein
MQPLLVVATINQLPVPYLINIAFLSHKHYSKFPAFYYLKQFYIEGHVTEGRRET